MAGLTFVFVQCEGSDETLQAAMSQLASQIDTRRTYPALPPVPAAPALPAPSGPVDVDGDTVITDEPVDEWIPPKKKAKAPKKPKLKRKYKKRAKAEPAVEEAEAPAAATPRKPQSPAATGGGFRDKAIEYLKRVGTPQRQATILREIGASPANSALKHAAFIKTEDGLYTLAGEKPAGPPAKKPVGAPAASAPSPQKKESAHSPATIDNAINVIAAELAEADGPMSLATIVKQTGMDESLVIAALDDDCFERRGSGYILAEEAED